MAGPDATDELATAQRAYDGGDIAAALDLLPAVVETRPDDLAVRLLLARCLAETAEPVVALAAAEAAVDIDRTSWQAQVLVARAARTIDPAAAHRAIDAAAHLAPAEPEVLAVRTALAEDDAARAGASRKRTVRGARSDGAGRGATMPGRPVTGVPGTDQADEMAARVLARARAAEESAAGQGPVLGDHPPATTGRADGTTPPMPGGGTSPTAPAPTLDRAPAPTDASTPAGAPAVAHAPTSDAAPVWTRDHASDAATDDEPDRKPLARQPLVLAGMACWLFIGFRVGVQRVGGPVGIAGFLLVVTLLGLYVRSRRTDAS